MDYGTRTDIWVKCSSSDIRHEIKDENIKLIIYEPDYLHHPIEFDYLDIISSSSCETTFFDFSIHSNTIKKLGAIPSTGLLTIEKLLTLTDKNKIRCFGFTFLQNDNHNLASHYFKDRNDKETIKRSKRHDFAKERVYLQNIFNQLN